jgi:protein-disulfide isomerase
VNKQRPAQGILQKIVDGIPCVGNYFNTQEIPMNAIRAALLAMTFLVPVTSAVAQTANPLADREDKIIPAVLLWMQQTGVKLTYLGNTGGIRGYLAESATGNMQTVYVAPDGLNAVIGLLYGTNYSEPGSNITGRQLDEMRKRYDAVANAVASVDLNNNATVEQALRELPLQKPEFNLPEFGPADEKSDILNKLREDGYELTILGQEGGLNGFFAKKSGVGQAIYVTPDAKHMVVGFMIERGGRNVSGVQIGEMRARFDSLDQKSKPAEAASSTTVKDTPVTTEAPSTEKQATTPALPTATPDTSALPAPVSANPTASAINLPAATGPAAGNEGNPSTVYLSTIDEKTFVDAVDKASWFDVGSATAPNLLYMVADPGCPFCHQTWDYIRPFIAANQLRVRVIMISFLKGSDPKAMEIMASAKPGIRYMETDAGAHMGTMKIDPDSEHYKSMAGHLLNNRKFTEKFAIEGTPFLAYQDKDGQFYISKGLPASLDSFFHAANLKK